MKFLHASVMLLLGFALLHSTQNYYNPVVFWIALFLLLSGTVTAFRATHESEEALNPRKD